MRNELKEGTHDNENTQMIMNREEEEMEQKVNEGWKIVKEKQ